jgi:hypothetical protein
VASENLSIHPLVDQILIFDVLRAKISPGNASKVLEALAKTYGDEAIHCAVATLDKKAAASIYKARSPEAYLRTVLENVAKNHPIGASARPKVSSLQESRTKKIEVPHEAEEDEDNESYFEEEQDAAAEVHYINEDEEDPS